jgi:hypothetical protein
LFGGDKTNSSSISEELEVTPLICSEEFFLTLVYRVIGKNSSLSKELKVTPPSYQKS